MNRIFKKCSNFGLMTRISTLDKDKALDIAKDLIKGNAPVVTIDISKGPEAIKVLNNIAFNADLFIAVEGVYDINSAYEAAGNGAQFYIINSPDEDLINTLRNSGFFFMCKVGNRHDIEKCKELGIEAVVISDINLLEMCELPYVLDCDVNTSTSYVQNSIFSILDIDNEILDYEDWINRNMQDYLGHRFTKVLLTEDSTESEESFAKLFSSINKSKLLNGPENSIIMECNNITQTINYLKWKSLYINPNDSNVIDGKVSCGPLDTNLNGFKIIIKEKNR